MRISQRLQPYLLVVRYSLLAHFEHVNNGANVNNTLKSLCLPPPKSLKHLQGSNCVRFQFFLFSFLFKAFMLGIIMQLNILARLTPQVTTIIYHYIKNIIKSKKEKKEIRLKRMTSQILLSYYNYYYTYQYDYQ